MPDAKVIAIPDSILVGLIGGDGGVIIEYVEYGIGGMGHGGKADPIPYSTGRGIVGFLLKGKGIGTN